MENCAVCNNGIKLRATCGGCNGHPSSGQRAYNRRDVAYRAGSAATAVFAVVEGYFRETRVSSDGRLQCVRLVGPGELAGTEGLCQDEYDTTLEALTPGRACAITTHAVREIVAGEPDQALAVIRALGVENTKLRNAISLTGPGAAADRVLEFVGQLSPGEGEWFVLPLTRQEVGEFLGLTLHTVSRTIHQLAQRGLLELKGREMRLLREVCV